MQVRLKILAMLSELETVQDQRKAKRKNWQEKVVRQAAESADG